MASSFALSSQSELVRGKATKILLLNPNSSQSMTDGMRTVIDDIDLSSLTEIYTYTGPASSPASINDGDDMAKSTEAVLADIHSYHGEIVEKYDGVLVACFSVHPLVPKLQAWTARDSALGPSAVVVATGKGKAKAVTGIFEASILTALSLLDEEVDQKWGIVTTGKFWEAHLSEGVRKFLLGSASDDQDGKGNINHKFAGVESTGLNASDFHHGVDPAVVRQKLKEATKRLLSAGNVHVIIMGCAGMVGLEEIIRSAVLEEAGERFAYSELHVIDGVRAGIMQVEQTIKHQRLRPGSS